MKPKAQTPALTTAEVAALIRKTFIEKSQEHINEGNAAAVMDAVLQELEAQKQAVTHALLGIDTRFGRVEINSQSPLVQETIKLMQPTVQEWVKEAVREILTDKRQATLRMQMKKEISARIAEECVSWKYANGAAQEIAEQIQKEALNEIRAELNLPAVS